jgi:hypothetical protein
MKVDYKAIDGRVIIGVLVIAACIIAFIAPYISS